MTRHHERYEAHRHEHVQPRHPQLNLIDLCKDLPNKRSNDSALARGFKAYEHDVLEQSKPGVDSITNELVKSLEQLDRRGTRAIEERYGKSLLTETLDATRAERYKIFGFVAREAARLGIDVVEEKVK